MSTFPFCALILSGLAYTGLTHAVIVSLSSYIFFLCLEDIISLVHWLLRSLCLLFYIITEPRREGVDKVIILLSAPKPHPLCRLDSCGSLCQLPSATRTFSDEIQ